MQSTDVTCSLTERPTKAASREQSQGTLVWRGQSCGPSTTTETPSLTTSLPAATAGVQASNPGTDPGAGTASLRTNMNIVTSQNVSEVYRASVDISVFK